MVEMLIASAIHKNGRTYVGKRHCHAIEQAASLAFEDMQFTCKATQGFITNKLRFVDRKEGRIIAENASQILNYDNLDDTTLYSENLW